MSRVVLFLIMPLMLFAVPILGQTESQQNSASNHYQNLIDSNFYEYRISNQFIHPENLHAYFYFQQQLDGIDILGSITTIVISEANDLLHVAQRITEQEQQKSTFNIQAKEQAFIKALESLELKSTPQLIEEKITLGPSQTSHYQSTDPKFENIRIQLSYLPRKKLELCWEVSFYDHTQDIWWDLFLHAGSLDVISKDSWTLSCQFGCKSSDHKSHREKNTDTNHKSATSVSENSYHVFAQPTISPLYGERISVSSPWLDATNASPFGWHDIDGVPGDEYNFTRGNNTFAYEDSDNNNAPGFSPSGGTELCFDFDIDLEKEFPEYYTDASITNLFYWNNLIHDILYQYAFTEPSGNFQFNNYGESGKASDEVLAEAQDGGATNNAKFTTPPDGQNPRMQMFNWELDVQAPSFSITSPPESYGDYEAKPAYFGIAYSSLEEELVDAIPLDGCEAFENPEAIEGKIALVDRGACPFTHKVKYAQEAGAIAAIICNNTDGPIINMPGTDTSIVIPAIMISQQDCETIRMNLPAEADLSLYGPYMLDSGFDNGVILHEYGHGLTNRLTGGAATTLCLNNEEQMGEGWSDYLALLLTMNEDHLAEDSRGIANYLEGDSIGGTGIRNFPYTVDMEINPLTYDDVKTEIVPHGTGTVWCAMLWEMTWNLVDIHGFDADVYNGDGGNNIALELVVEALKLQPCHPGFVDARDAILAADLILFDGENQCAIWQAFAKRGLGAFADQGSSDNQSDGQSSFELPISCKDTFGVYQQIPLLSMTDDTIEIAFTVFNNLDYNVENIQLSDQIESICLFDASNENCGYYEVGTFNMNVESLIANTDSSCVYKLTTTADLDTVFFFSGAESTENNWTIYSGQGQSDFRYESSLPFQGLQHWYIENIGSDNTQYLQSPSLSIQPNQVLSFRHFYNTENDWDGGFVELSLDEEAWFTVEDLFLLNGYNSVINESSNPDINFKHAFSGSSEEYIHSIIDLTAYSGSEIFFRFVFGSDNNTFVDGWYIDNISLQSMISIANIVCVDAMNAPEFCDTLSHNLVAPCDHIYTLYLDNDNDGFGCFKDSISYCKPSLSGYSSNTLDCNDNDSQDYPDATELCDGKDNNCNGVIDENCPGNYLCQEEIISVQTANQTHLVASQSVHSNGSQTIENLHFIAGDTVTLDVGFEIPIGKQFKAIIETCSDSLNN